MYKFYIGGGLVDSTGAGEPISERLLALHRVK